MTLFALQFELREISIDKNAMMGAIDSAEPGRLQELGEAVDDVATNSLRFRGRASRPGQSPTAWSTGARSLRNIQSAYIASDHSVIIGSIGLASRRMLGGKTVPELLEFGGVYTRLGRGGDRSTVRIAARPNMAPSLERVAQGSLFRRVMTMAFGGRS